VRGCGVVCQKIRRGEQEINPKRSWYRRKVMDPDVKGIHDQIRLTTRGEEPKKAVRRDHGCAYVLNDGQGGNKFARTEVTEEVVTSRGKCRGKEKQKSGQNAFALTRFESDRGDISAPKKRDKPCGSRRTILLCVIRGAEKN